MNKTYAKIGSISHGTMRPEDLIPAFMDALDDIREEMCQGSVDSMKEQIARIHDFLGDLEERCYSDNPEDMPDSYWEGEQCMYDLQELEDMLNEFAPPCCYFGASEGDGACYGYFPCWDVIRDGIHDGNIIEWNMGKGEYPEDEIRERKEAGVLEYVLAISDHGNATLYDTEGNEVWGIV